MDWLVKRRRQKRKRQEKVEQAQELQRLLNTPAGTLGDPRIRLSCLEIERKPLAEDNNPWGLELRQWEDLRTVRLYNNNRLRANFDAYKIGENQHQLYWAVKQSCWVLVWRQQFSRAAAGPHVYREYTDEILVLRSSTLEGLVNLATEMDLVDQNLVCMFVEINKGDLFERDLPAEAYTVLQEPKFRS